MADNTNSLQVFVFDNDKPVRIVHIDGEPWWVAKDVCDILGHSNSRMAIQDLDEDEKGVSKIYTPGGMQDMTVISEAGLYTLLMRSNKEQAKPFRRWVTHDVLPAIRSTGQYINPAVQNIPALAVPDPAASKLRYVSRGIMSSARKIISEALHCESEKDFQTVIALDRIFTDFTGVSALDLAGIKLIVRKHTSVHQGNKGAYNGYTLTCETTEHIFDWEHSLPTLPDTSYFTIAKDELGNQRDPRNTWRPAADVFV